ncbi:unnamed protein product [Rotaria magnacalcarata]|uniref:Nanos-type domain-containing protein n=2 Tax=Rotaria magnacalcarata TaxID=392030 RepID=A0A819WAL3_9BILA|nr:unnamed protein product [Rotaria magnacalcarata]CAF1471094.1 unnamed protein product [Rotaria magnacalcarata]CAF2073514.1 unnamed protein product [Rotaria magnacalcarata]CAF2178593.1 unnamed protein product [Rotaria magnacalcarata]CAF4122865.1 unnamed protein product [Rotaria magnacalcarata]
MYHYYSGASNKTLTKTISPLMMENTNTYSRETAFDPLNYAFDAETMIEPFTYFQDGPGESRRKPIIFPSISSSSSFSNSLWSPTSSISPSDENPPNHYHQYNNMLHSKHQQPPQQSQYPKTICRHCKSHNMPECLYTSHSMYDESGEIFCPVLKKCHCTNCIRVINSTERHDDDSDDDNNLRYLSNDNEFGHLYEVSQRQNSYRLNNNNNF